MNPFERHGITRLSPSTLNHFAAEPAHWVMQRLLNMRAPVSAAAVRGTAVERGVHLGLISPDLPVEQCVAAAEAAFDREMVLNADDRRETNAATSPVMRRMRCPNSARMASRARRKDRVQIWLDDVPLPIEGCLDWGSTSTA